MQNVNKHSETNSSFTSNSALMPQINWSLSLHVWIYEKERKTTQIYFPGLWLLIMLPVSSTFGATVLAERLIVLNKFAFSRHIPLAPAVKHDLINSSLLNDFHWLAKKYTPRNSSLLSLFVKDFCCNEIFHCKCSNISNCCFPVSWKYCEDSLVW